jgi:hypothetical protein
LSTTPAVFVDGTFDICEEKLILTTVLGLRGSLFTPCAWMLHDQKTTEVFENFFNVRFRLSNNILAFEEANGKYHGL